MASIQEKNILEAADKINNLTEEALDKISETYYMSQINFFGYLVSSSLEFKNDELLDFIAFYFTVFMEAASSQGVKLKTIEDEDIEVFQEEYFDILDEYQETEDEDLIKTFCNQPMLLDFLMSDIHGVDEDGESLSEEMKSQLFIVGVALIALLNKAIIS